MLASVLAATLHGLEGRPVRVEVDVAPGLPGFTIVGLADAALREARERVRGALRNSGFVHPPRRITVNLAPADVPKAGSALDLGIALAVLVGSEQVIPRGRWALTASSASGARCGGPGATPDGGCLARRGAGRVVDPLTLSTRLASSRFEVVGPKRWPSLPYPARGDGSDDARRRTWRE